MYSSSSSRGRSSSPFSSYRKPPSPSSYSSSSSSTSSFYNGRIIPKSSPSSVSSHYYGSSNGAGTRSVTPSRSRSMRTPPPPPPPLVVPFPSADELVIEDTSRSGDSISVTIRFRPLSEREIHRGDEISWYADGERLVRSEYNPATAYAYDRVFGPSTATQAVYDVAARPVVKAAMEGINGTVFAYGVTSSGKTHTMHGDQNSPGIIPLAIKDVFSIIQDTPGREFLLRVSYIEIYNEVINDLLDPTGQNLRVREDHQGTYVEGIKEEVVLSPGHALSFIAAGEEHRHVGSNNFNLFSSRSHTIFTLMIESSARGDEYDGVMYSQLNLIDLAGSESSKTETTGLRRKEGSYINKSLLTLGTVIGKLSEGKASHIPYRDSKLTRLLQSSLSGHGHVSLICTITPASSNMEETHNTLKFASRAKRVEIYASRNRIIDEKSLIKKYQREISTLKQELDQLRRGMLTGVSHEEIMSLRQQLEEGQVKMQSRLEEEEEAKAALMSRIQRLTKLILVSTKNTIPGVPNHERSQSVSEEDKLDIFSQNSPLLENEKDTLSSSLSDPLDPSKQNGENYDINSSATEQAGISATDHMDLLVEQVKMLAGEIAFSTSTLKRLVEQSVDDPESTKTQIQNLEREIQEKRRQMRALEQKITETGEGSLASASLVDMQQTITKLTAQCSEKAFELELRTADNRILQEQLQNKYAENNELQERITLLEQQLGSMINEKPTGHSESDEVEYLKSKHHAQETENEKLRYELMQLNEDYKELMNQKKKLADEASYAKELASSAAVELKSLAEEVTKLSVQNAKQAKELKNLQRSRPGSRASREFTNFSLDETSDLDSLKTELSVRKQREAVLEAALAEKEVIEEEYKRKLDDAKKRELTLENDLAGMWVLVARLKRGALGVPEKNGLDERSSNGELVNGDVRVAVNKVEKEDGVTIMVDKPVVTNDSTKDRCGEDPKSGQFEPVLVRLKAKIQEMKEKESDSPGEKDANSHVCKVCFESPTAAVLLPCRHFCLCKPCSLACSECPICRSSISDRIITFT
ncbi:Kinesin-like protein KIN-7G [Rhynchospora pubera]|uniref:Kinesin-like protein KIN-7G n=1 Tax=Rhynchospora pubera TaxID=906938 RepID=A0AAV8E7F7_9POAL|nr:Kinesin-like protein KIN-7G [Rhynchospora pubera]KAJ4803496.1 Kinesin-like protein KIN-7G [Rhynchospora pubera]